MTAIFLRVAAQHFNTTLTRQHQPHALTLHLEFLRRTSIGQAVLRVRDVKLGRQTSTIHVALAMHDEARDAVVGYITHADLAAEAGVTYATAWTLQPAPPAVDFGALAADRDANWARLEGMPFGAFRKAATRTRWFVPRAVEMAQAVGRRDVWMQLDSRGRDGRGERWTNASVGFVADLFPQLIETFAAPGLYAAGNAGGDVNKGAGAKFWYPTLLLNLDVKKALPDEGVEWLFLRVATKMVNKGRYDLEVVVMDQEGDVVCLSHHVCFALSAERNLKARTKADTPRERL